jgi:hypothetical protein
MALTTYTAGEVLTAASLNDNLAYAITVPVASAGGLVPIVPTSVSVGSGTATTSANGTVTFTGSTTVLLNGVFTASYTNYRVLFHGLGASSSNNLRSRYSLSGTPSTTNYTSGFIAVDYSFSASWSYVGNGGTTYNPVGWIDNAANSSGGLAFDVYQPAIAIRTFHNGLTTSVNGGAANSGGVIMGMHEAATAYDGIQFYNSAGTNMTGKISVYGYAI